MDKESIFAEALEKDSPADRARFLDEACAGDAKLRAEIEHLLAAHNDAGSFLNRPPDELELTADSDGNTSRDEFGEAWRELLEPSDNPDCLGLLGPYEVVELVGRGGMGVVLRARDAKLNRTVAIKLLAPELSANAMAVRRFLREAQAAAAVSHDHVVTIHAIDESARPPIIVMEYVDGLSLQQKIDAAGALDVKSILRIGMQTAAGLAAAHRQGLVHRDIKPSNILLENGIERVKLTDFGLARAVDDIGMTRTGQITGTPQYMSPEQAQGKPIDYRTDLFSLGCVLYAMCTGRAAFRADSAVAVMHRVVHDIPRPIREFNDDMPVWLCEIVDRLIEKNPDDRFESAEEVECLLGRHLIHLQQPESEPRPEHAWPVRVRSVAELDEKTEQGLTFVRNVLAFFGVLCVMWFVGCLAMPYHGFSGFGFTMPTLLVSLLTGGLAINGAWHAAHRQSYGWTLIGSIGLLFPVNLPQMLGLFFTIWASAILWRQDIKDAFESQANASQYYGTRHSSETATPSWLRRVPIPTWIALLLFLVVFACAVSEWTGISHELGARPNGVLFYLLGTGFVFVWGCCVIVTRLIRGPHKSVSALPPSGSQITGFFATVILLTGVFVWQWTGLSNEMERERMLGFFVGHGSITLRLKNPDTKVEFNGTAIEVPADGVVVIRPDKPGGFVLARHHASGWVGHSECLIYSGMNADFSILEEATRVIVTGPIRGKIDDESSAGQRSTVSDVGSSTADEEKHEGANAPKALATDLVQPGGIAEDLAAQSLFRNFERSIQEADAAGVIYEGEITTTKNGVTTAKSYWGAYQAAPGGKTATRPPTTPFWTGHKTLPTPDTTATKRFMFASNSTYGTLVAFTD